MSLHRRELEERKIINKIKKIHFSIESKWSRYFEKNIILLVVHTASNRWYCCVVVANKIQPFFLVTGTHTDQRSFEGPVEVSIFCGHCASFLLSVYEQFRTPGMTGMRLFMSNFRGWSQTPLDCFAVNNPTSLDVDGVTKQKHKAV